MIEEKDKIIASNFIIVGILLETLEKDLHSVKNSPLRFRNIHKLLIEQAVEKARKELAQLKKEMRTRGIKVLIKKLLTKNFGDILIWFEGMRMNLDFLSMQ